MFFGALCVTSFGDWRWRAAGAIGATTGAEAGNKSAFLFGAFAATACDTGGHFCSASSSRRIRSSVVRRRFFFRRGFSKLSAHQKPVRSRLLGISVCRRLDKGCRNLEGLAINPYPHHHHDRRYHAGAASHTLHDEAAMIAVIIGVRLGLSAARPRLFLRRLCACCR
jgi:hypothetical protein